MCEKIVGFVRDVFKTKDFIPLHAPKFAGNEARYVQETINSTFVSSVGAFVDDFERKLSEYSGVERAVAVVNGTAALHIALKLSNVEAGDLVITQALTFVATCNAIRYCGADPVFVDVDKETLGLSAGAMQLWLSENAVIEDGLCIHKLTRKVIRACVPMHTFGHPADLDGLVSVCAKWGIILVEDAAESLGSFYKGRHTGSFGLISALSFNGNKIITTGGGGALLTNTELGTRAKYLTTTAKRAHPYEYFHDELAYNYRLPNINAALGCAQMEVLDDYIGKKRQLASAYRDFFCGTQYAFVDEPLNCRSNFWLNAVVCENEAHRNQLLEYTNNHGVMTRPIWVLMNKLPMFSSCLRGDLKNSEWLEERVVNIPSSVLTEV
ncbi:MAG: LegC family aminotransferase [Candidatus Planktophila sp.]